MHVTFAAKKMSCIMFFTVQETSKGLTSSKIQDSIVEITNLLVARGGQLGLQDSQGKAPADIARDKNFTDLADLMEKLKGKVIVKSVM